MNIFYLSMCMLAPSSRSLFRKLLSTVVRLYSSLVQAPSFHHIETLLCDHSNSASQTTLRKLITLLRLQLTWSLTANDKLVLLCGLKTLLETIFKQNLTVIIQTSHEHSYTDMKNDEVKVNQPAQKLSRKV